MFDVVPFAEVHDLRMPFRPLELLNATRRMQPALVILDHSGGASITGITTHLLSVVPDLVVVGLGPGRQICAFRRPITERALEGWPGLAALVQEVGADHEESEQ